MKEKETEKTGFQMLLLPCNCGKVTVFLEDLSRDNGEE